MKKYTFSEAELCSRLGGLVWFDASNFTDKNKECVSWNICDDPTFIYGFVTSATSSNIKDVQGLRYSACYIDNNLHLAYVLLDGTTDYYVIDR